MSTGYFSRTGRNALQKNLNKPQLTTQEVANPSQINTIPAEETSQGGYVYKPPTRIVRTNAVNQSKQTVKQSVKKTGEKAIQDKNDASRQSIPVKNKPSFMRKPQNQTQKPSNQAKTQTKDTQSIKKQEKSSQDINSYQRKPSNQPQKSQSTTSIKSSQPVYSNKIQTPQENVEESEVKKPQIKRFNLIIYSLHKISVRKSQSFFQQICAFSQLRKEAKVNETAKKELQRVVMKLCIKYENRLVQNALGLMKSIYSKLVKTQMIKSTDTKILNQLIAQRNQCFIKVLESITSNQLAQKRQAFNNLRTNFIKQAEKKKKIIYGAKILLNQEFKRLKQGWSLISELSTVRNCMKSLKLGRCSIINKNLRKEILFCSFRKMEIVKLKQNNQQSKKESEQPNVNKKLRQNVQQLQQLKKNPQKLDEESQLRNTIARLKEESQVISEELKAKREKNVQLKQKVEQLIANKSFSQQQEMSSISENKVECQEPTLSLLHEIYMKVFKQTEEQCVSEQNIRQLCNIHKVEQNQVTRQPVAQWLAVQKNLLLKHCINLYEGNYISEVLQPQQLSSSQVNLHQILSQREQQRHKFQQQNSIIRKLIRSYIKERYMWEQVKEYVAAATTSQ